MERGFLVDGRLYKTIGEAGRAAGTSKIIYKRSATGLVTHITFDDQARGLNAYFKLKIPGWKRMNEAERDMAIVRLVQRNGG